MNTEAATQQMRMQIANAYNELRDEIVKSDTSQMERLLTENEYARIIFVRDSLIQRMRFLATDYFQERVGSATKALRLSEQLMEGVWKRDITRINYAEMLRRINELTGGRLEKAKAGTAHTGLKKGSRRGFARFKRIFAVTEAVTALPALIKSWYSAFTGRESDKDHLSKDKLQAVMAKLLKEREDEVTDILCRMISDMGERIETLTAEWEHDAHDLCRETEERDR